MFAGRPRRGIRAPRGVGNAVNDGDFEKTWTCLESSFREIHTKNASKLSYEELYRRAYSLVLKRRGEELYNRVIDFERGWLTETVQEEVKALLSSDLLPRNSQGLSYTNTIERRVAGEKLLKGLKQAWADYQLCMAMLSDVLMYMDKANSNDRQPPVYLAAMQLFRDCILKSETQFADPDLNVLIVTVNTILEHVQMERDGDVIDKTMIKSCTYMLEALYLNTNDAEDQRLYNLDFEPRFLQVSRQFYQAESNRLLRDCDAGAYCRQARRRIAEEQDRCLSTLSEATMPKIVKVVEEEMIRNKIKELIEMESGVAFMIDNDRLEELGLIYELNARVDDKKFELTKAIQKRIVEMGNEVNKSALAPAASEGSAANQQTLAAINWVEQILDLKDKFDNISKSAFRDDQSMQSATTRSFADFINSSTFSRGSEYISLFIDDNMKKGIRDKTDAEVDMVLDKAITLLRYILDKDLFERYYKKHLSRRLLMNKSISIDVEMQMIGRMKVELGKSFTTKLEAMFKDMTISEELTSDFKRHLSAASSADDSSRPIDLTINVLTSMTWPLEVVTNTSHDETIARSKVAYPPSLEKIKQRFELFYQKKHNGRKLTWQPGMGTADIKVKFPKVPGKEGSKDRNHEINVSTYAMLVLLLFNNLPSDRFLTFGEIQAQTNIPAHDLARNLQALAVAPKTRILRKEPMSKEVNENDKFYFNDSFHSKFFRVKILVVASGNRVESERERLKTEKKNDEHRTFITEAAIVRIMKQRKELPHQQLLTETISQLTQFRPEVSMIKNRIESLIEREYLERMDEGNKYRYLA